MKLGHDFLNGDFRVDNCSKLGVVLKYFPEFDDTPRQSGQITRFRRFRRERSQGTRA